ncbi:reverse transcriptase domain-containing protein [Tanacetum coccineum]
MIYHCWVKKDFHHSYAKWRRVTVIKRAMENLNFFYQDIGTSSSVGGLLTQEEAAKEAIAIRMSRKFALLEEERPIIETMAYNDKYKKILDEVWKDNVELDGKIIKEEEEAVKRIKGEALKEKEDPGAFIFPIRLEGQVGVTTLIAKFLILDILIDRDSPIVIGRGFLRTIGGIVNAPKRLFSTFDGFCHQTFRATRSDFMRNVESEVQVNWKPDYKGSYTKEEEAIGQWQTKIRLKEYAMMRLDHHDPNAQDNMKPWKNYCIHKFTTSFCYGKGVAEMQSLEINDMLRIRLREAGSNEEIFTSVAWIRAFNINEPIYTELCHEFYSTYEFDEVCADDELHCSRGWDYIKRLELDEEGFKLFTLKEVLLMNDNFNAHEYWLSISREDNLGLSRSHTSTIRNPILRVIHKMITYGLCQRMTGYDKIQKNYLWLLSMFDARHQNGVLTEDVVRSLSAPIYCRDLDTITLRDLIDSDGKLIPEDPQLGVPRVGIPRPLRASMQDLYDRMGRMDIRQKAIERIKYREPTTHLVMLSHSMTSTISSTHLRHHSIRSSSRMMSSVEMARVGEPVVVISSDKVEGSGDWNSLEFQDTANSGKKKETKGMVFYQMETEEVSDRFVAPCFVNGLEAYDGQINLGVEENMISNEYAVKLCLEHEVKKGNKVVKKELIVALRGEIYFVKFIINPEEDDVEPGVIFGRSFLRLTKEIIDFGVGTVTIYPDIDPFLEETEEEGKSNDDWDHLLDFNIDDVPLLGEEGLPPFVCKMGKSSHNKKRAMKNLNFFYQDIGTSSSADKLELDGKIVKKEEEAVKRIKGESLKEKDDPGAFIFPIRLEEHVNENALADTVSDINTMPFRIYVQLGRDDMKKVGVTTLIAKFLILDILIDYDSPIVIGRGFLYVMRNAESDSDDEEDYQIKRNKFGASIYGPKPAPYLSCNDPVERSLAIETVTNLFQKISFWKKAVGFLGSLPVPLKNVNWKTDYKGSYTKEEEATGQWKTEIRLTNPYGNIPIDNPAPPVVTMADNRTMAQLLQAPTEGYEDAIVVPAITADNFELKHGLLTLVQNKQFFGLDKEDPHAHIRYFNKITSTMKFPNVPSTSVKLMLFPFSLEGAARIWLEKEPPRSILTWDDLVSKFINQFFPPSKTTNLRNEITNFQQRFDESFYEAWDRFNDLLRACPHHGFSELHQLDTFYNALNSNDQDSLNSAAGGNFLDKMPRDCLRIIESKSKVRHSRSKAIVAKVGTSSSTPGISPDVAELKDMVKALLLDKKNQSQAPATVKAVEESCVTCGGAHSYHNCPATDGNVYRDNIQAVAVNYNQGNTGYRPLMVANQIRPPSFPPVQQNQGNNQNCYNQNRGNNYNQGPIYRPPANHPPVYQAPPYQAPAPQTQGVSKDDFQNYVKANDAVMRNMQNQNQNLQNQMTNLTDMLTKFVNSNTASTSGSGTLPSNTITNPKEFLKGITTRSGVAYQGPTIPTTSSSPPKVVERETEVTKDTVPPTNNGSTEDVQPPVVQVETHVPIFEPVVAPVSAPKPNPKPSIPYPSRLNDQKIREKANNQIEKFYQIFQDLHFDISFADALILMPKFASTLKSLISNKEKLFELARTPLNEHCSAVLLKKLLEKLGDPSKFLIPCVFPEWMSA